MRHGLLKALLGKHILCGARLAYCHVDRVIITEGNKAIATVILKTLNERIMHWFVETQWHTDDYGVHKILGYKILKEDELNGYTEGNKPV